MRNVRILPYKAGSQSASALATSLSCLRINLERSNIYNLRPKKIINWGNSGRNLPPQGLGDQHTILNPLSNVKVAGNKLTALQTLSEAGVRVPDFTTDWEKAYSWWVDDGQSVVARHTLTGSGGEGIELVGPDGYEEIFPQAPLYTKYVKKQDEYRIHVMNGVVIDMQRKARNTEVDDGDVNWQIRNHSNGFIFMRENVNPNRDVINQAIAAVTALNLDFGAVDVVWNAHQSQAYVLEVNTACGLEGTTLERYTAAFQAVLNGERPESVLPAPSAAPAPVVDEPTTAGELSPEMEQAGWATVDNLSTDFVEVTDRPNPQEQQYRVVTDREVRLGDTIRYLWTENHSLRSGSIGTVDYLYDDDGSAFKAIYDNDSNQYHNTHFRGVRWEIVEPINQGTTATWAEFSDSLRQMQMELSNATWSPQELRVGSPITPPPTPEFPESIQEEGSQPSTGLPRGTVLRLRQDFYTIAAGSLVVVGNSTISNFATIYPINGYSSYSGSYNNSSNEPRIQVLNRANALRHEIIGKYSELFDINGVKLTEDNVTEQQEPEVEDANTEYAIAVEGKVSSERYASRSEANAALNESFFYNLRRLYSGIGIQVVAI